MLTPEEKAEISRQNGAKSKGPVTEEGKAKSRLNALKSGDHATTLSMFVPPHSAVICNEDRHKYAHLMDELLAIYQPVNSLAVSIVQSIAVARWELARLRACVTMHWNSALLAQPSSPNPDLAEIHAMTAASSQLYGPNGPVRMLNRQIDQLEIRIGRLEKRLRFVHANFPTNPPKRTQPDSPQPTENTAPKAEKAPILYITENKPEVVQAYQLQFPNREIVVLPPDDVAKGIDIEDDMPIAPRRVV